MKKKIFRVIGVLLIVLQIGALFAALPVSALTNYYVGKTNSYTTPQHNNIIEANQTITLDGANTSGEWDEAISYSGFVDSNGATTSSSFKAMWYNDGTTAYLYVLLNIIDSTPYYVQEHNSSAWASDSFSLSVDENNDGVAECNTPTMFIFAERSNMDRRDRFSHISQKTDTGYLVEMQYQFKTTSDCSGSIKFNVGIQDNFDGTYANNHYTRYVWGGGTFADTTKPTVVGSLISNAKSYTVYKTNTPVDINTEAPEADWANVPSQALINTQYTAQDYFSASFKALWYTNGTDAYLYILANVADTTPAGIGDENSAGDAIFFNIDENGDGQTDFSTPSMWFDGRSLTEDQTPGIARFTYKTHDHRQDSGTYTLKLQYKFLKTESCTDNINFDICIQDNYKDTQSDSSAYSRYSWVNCNDQKTAGGHGIISDFKASDIVAIDTLDGVSMRATEDKASTGLRWETEIEKATYDKLIADCAEIKTGTLILPTSYIAGLDASKLNKKYLTAAGIKHLDVENEGFAIDDEDTYTFFGSITNIKEANHTRDFSGVGYIEITYADGTSATFYGGYSEADHSRNVKEVATKAYNDTAAGYSASMLAILATYAEITVEG